MIASKFARVHMSTAWRWSEEGTCQRLRVGAVLALDERSVASGYNGAPKGLPHCTHELRASLSPDEDRCKNAVHTEMNVIAFAARYGRSTDGTTLYITHSPCYSCSGAIISAGIVKVIYSIVYRGTEGLDQLELAGIELEKYNCGY